jgi:hypothetical protein
VPGLVAVPLGAAGEVHDDLRARHGGLDAVAGGQVAGHVLDAVHVVVTTAAEHPDVAPGVDEARDDEPSQGAGTAGDQDG